VAPRARPHPHRLRIRGFGYFSNLGPGLVTGASDDDPSGIGTYSQVGAAFRFGFLWTAPFTLPLVAAVQETAGRLGLVTGEGLATLIRRRYPRPVLVVCVGLVTVANVFNIGADLGAMAGAVQLLIPVPFAILIIAMTGGMLALEIAVPYRRYSRVLRWLTASLLTYIAVLFVVNVDWSEVIRSTLVPMMTWDGPHVAALIAILGTTISPYLFLWQTSEEVEEREGELHRVDAVDVRHMRVDILSGMGSAVVVMFAIMVASGATLGARGSITVETADQAAQALKPIAGELASLLFTLGIVGTGSLAVPVLAGSTAYALTEAAARPGGLSRSFRQARTFYLILAAAMVLGLGMNFAGLNPVRALYYAAILNGLAAPPLILVMWLLSRSRAVVGDWTGGRVSNGLLLCSFALMTVLPIVWLIVR
jgi:NRAMP (natural resistance-associated macrophage protein)-like metal ion transporter